MTQVARELQDRLVEEKERQNWAEALDLADRLMRITPDDRSLGEERTWLSLQKEKAQARKTAAAAPAAAGGPEEGLEIQALLDRSRAALGAGDAFTAFHYASLARELDGRGFEAGQLLLRVPGHDRPAGPAGRPRGRGPLPAEAGRGRGAGPRRDAHAWRLLRDLAREYPHDREIGELARESLRRARRWPFSPRRPAWPCCCREPAGSCS